MMTASQVFTIGANHRVAPVSLREMLSVPASAVGERLRDLLQKSLAREAAIVSTCNRTEIYCLAQNPEPIAQWLHPARPVHSARPDSVHSAQAGPAQADPFPALYQLRHRDAVAHLFRVAAGLDSQILGETEIAGQVKTAAKLARESGAAGAVINRLMDRALAVSKEIRRSAAVSRGSLSYPALAAKLAAKLFPDFRESAVLFLGAGDMAAAGIRVFAGRGARRIAVAGQSTVRAAELAARVNGEAMTIPQAAARLAEFDIVISATASPVPVVGKGAVERALARRRRRPVLIADLAAPRDVEPEVANLPDVFLYTLDHFGEMAKDARDSRSQAVSAAEEIVSVRADEFCKWLDARNREPMVRRMRADAEEIRRRETSQALARIARGENPAAEMERLSRRLAAKLLHAPTRFLRDPPPPPPFRFRRWKFRPVHFHFRGRGRRWKFPTVHFRVRARFRFR